jgi:hypothetical protein
MGVKNKFKIVRRGTKWCVRVKPTTDEFDREAWPAYAVREWLDGCGIPYETKKREYVTIHNQWWSYDAPATWKRDYLFERKEDATMFLLRWR